MYIYMCIYMCIYIHTNVGVSRHCGSFSCQMQVEEANQTLDLLDEVLMLSLTGPAVAASLPAANWAADDAALTHVP
jgi:hypothetical protein